MSVRTRLDHLFQNSHLHFDGCFYRLRLTFISKSRLKRRDSRNCRLPVGSIVSQRAPKCNGRALFFCGEIFSSVFETAVGRGNGRTERFEKRGSGILVYWFGKYFSIRSFCPLKKKAEYDKILSTDFRAPFAARDFQKTERERRPDASALALRTGNGE